jgi:hypothetical protein
MPPASACSIGEQQPPLFGSPVRLNGKKDRTLETEVSPAKLPARPDKRAAASHRTSYATGNHSGQSEWVFNLSMKRFTTVRVAGTPVSKKNRTALQINTKQVILAGS